MKRMTSKNSWNSVETRYGRELLAFETSEYLLFQQTFFNPLMLHFCEVSSFLGKRFLTSPPFLPADVDRFLKTVKDKNISETEVVLWDHNREQKSHNDFSLTCSFPICCYNFYPGQKHLHQFSRVAMDHRIIHLKCRFNKEHDNAVEP